MRGGGRRAGAARRARDRDALRRPRPGRGPGGVDRTKAELGRVDVLVNNAGTSWGAPPENVPLEGWQKVIDVNLTGVFLFAQAVGRVMIEQGGGTIVNVASVAAFGGAVPELMNAIAYNATKGGVVALTRDLAAKWARHGISVNAIAPGWFPSDMTGCCSTRSPTPSSIASRSAASAARTTSRARSCSWLARVRLYHRPGRRRRRRPVGLVTEEPAPLLVLESVEAFLDRNGLGTGPVRATRIGEGGGSNFSFLLERDDDRFVLRRPPRPPLPPSAHDMVREARLQLALTPHGIRLPTIRAVCEDEGVIGVPFYVMDYLEGPIVTRDLPPGLETEEARRRLGFDLVDALVEIHAVDVSSPGIADFVPKGATTNARCAGSPSSGRSTGRGSCRRSSRSVSGWPRTCPTGPARRRAWDYRLGNVMLARAIRPECAPCSTGRWERSATPAPISATCSIYSQPGGDQNPLGISPVTASPASLAAELAERYVERSGRAVEPFEWFQALALWKAAVFCEAIYGRFIRGELAAEDQHAAARFEDGVPLLAETALYLIS